jgi:hypothetical protein
VVERSVTQITPGDASLAFSGGQRHGCHYVKLSNGQQVEWETSAFERALNDFKAALDLCVSLSSYSASCFGSSDSSSNSALSRQAYAAKPYCNRQHFKPQAAS